MSSLQVFSLAGDLLIIIGFLSFIYTLIKKDSSKEEKFVTLIIMSLGFVFSSVPRLVIGKDKAGSMADLSILMLVLGAIIFFSLKTNIKSNRILFNNMGYFVGGAAILMALSYSVWRIVLLWI